MGWHQPDPYNQPEAFDLEIVATLGDEALDYEYNMFVVWRNAVGVYFYAKDAGCSCVAPFEDFHSADDLTPASKRDILEEAKLWGATVDQMDGLRTALGL